MKKVFLINILLFLATFVLAGTPETNKSYSVDHTESTLQGPGGIYTPNVPNVIPPSPTSRVLQKFLGYPVSHATGMVNINVPLYSLQVNRLSIPLELKYHTSGVKIQDPAGIVGRNWSLFPGFKISRTIMGKPDEMYPVTALGNSPSQEDLIRISAPFNQMECTTYGNIDTNRMDGQYDIFNIHMPGANASFIIKRQGNMDVVQVMPDSPVKIVPLIDTSSRYLIFRIYGFEVTDQQGIKYYFGQPGPIQGADNGFIEQAAIHNDRPISGWMLREIVFPSEVSQKISFSYQMVTENVATYRGKTVLDKGVNKGFGGCYWDEMINIHTGSNSPYWRILGPDGYKIENIESHAHSNQSLVPTSIIWDNGQVSFTYESGMLKTMVVKNKSNSTVKTVQCTYNNSVNKLLKTVTLSGEGKYQFKYKDEDNITIGSSSFDWWGYRNGGDIYPNEKLPNITLEVVTSRGGNHVPGNRIIGDGANRKPNELYMAARSLEQITYPTGGTFKLEYETHRFQVKRIDKTGGGLRIKSTQSYDPVSGKTITKSYSYENPHYTANDYPDEKSLVTTKVLCTLDAGSCMVRQRTLSVFSSHADVAGNSLPVWYGKVFETSEEGKTEYTYDFIPDKYDHVNDVDFLSSQSNAECLVSRINRLVYPAPWLLTQKHYKKDGNQYIPVEETIHTYTRNISNHEGIVAVPYRIPWGYTSMGAFMNRMTHCHNYCYYEIYRPMVHYYYYHVSGGWHNLASTEKRTYLGNDTVTEKVTYTYDSARPYNVSQKKTLLSDGNELIEKYYYSNNTIPNRSVLTSSQQSAISNLTTRNRLTTVVQQSLEKNGVQLHNILSGFYNNVLCMPENVYFQKSVGTFENRMFYRYDKYGNPIYVVKDGIEKIAYLWSYKGEYPVAEIRNATYDDVKNGLNGTLPESLSENVSPNMTAINGLRSRLTHALVTAYTYKPLWGIESMTDTRGFVANHSYYDNAALLKEIYFNEGSVKRILENYEYNYKNQ